MLVQDVHDSVVKSYATHVVVEVVDEVVAYEVADKVVQPDSNIADEMVQLDAIVADEVAVTGPISSATADIEVTSPSIESSLHTD